jgi:Integrase zinc binding domain
MGYRHPRDVGDSWIASLREKMQNHHDNTPCKIIEYMGLWRYKDKVCVGNTSGWRHKIITKLHTSNLGGHSGITATYHKIKRNFYWPLLKENVHQFVHHCSNCHINKGEHTAL